MKWPLDFIAGKIQLDSFDQSNNSVVIDLKMNKSNHDEESSYYVTVASFSLRWRSYSVFIAKAASEKIGALICL